MINFLIFVIPLAAAWLQGMGVSVFSVFPNLALMALVAAAFFVSRLNGMLIIAGLSVMILKFSPGFSWELVFIFITATLVFLIKEKLPWTGFLNALFLGVALAALFYVIFSPALIFSFTFLKELILDIVFLSLVFWTLWENRGVRGPSFRTQRKLL